MPKLHVLFTRVLDGELNAQRTEDELNRVLSDMEGEVLSVQVEELQAQKEYKLYVLTK